MMSFFDPSNCLRPYLPTKEQVKMMEVIREGHEAYGLMSSKINPRFKELSGQRTLDNESYPFKLRRITSVTGKKM